jgi:hypothetical protein
MSTGFSFGDTRFIDPGMAGVALVTTVLFLALCDYATHLLEDFFRHSTTYMTMLQKIYKELMIMGELQKNPAITFKIAFVLSLLLPQVWSAFAW